MREHEVAQQQLGIALLCRELEGCRKPSVHVAALALWDCTGDRLADSIVKWLEGEAETMAALHFASEARHPQRRDRAREGGAFELGRVARDFERDGRARDAHDLEQPTRIGRK